MREFPTPHGNLASTPRENKRRLSAFPLRILWVLVHSDWCTQKSHSESQRHGFWWRLSESKFGSALPVASRNYPHVVLLVSNQLPPNPLHTRQPMDVTIPPVLEQAAAKKVSFKHHPISAEFTSYHIADQTPTLRVQDEAPALRPVSRIPGRNSACNS